MTDLEEVPEPDVPAAVAAPSLVEDDAVPTGYERVTPRLIFRKKNGDAFVKIPKTHNLAKARETIAALIAVAEEYKHRCRGLVNGNRVLDNAVKTLADDRARVEAWEAQFTSDKERFPDIAWLVRQEAREDGTTLYFAIYAPAVEGEQKHESWREAMNVKLQLDEIAHKAAEAQMRADLEAKLAEVKALVDSGVPEPEAMARVFPAPAVEPESIVAVDPGSPDGDRSVQVTMERDEAGAIRVIDIEESHMETAAP